MGFYEKINSPDDLKTLTVKQLGEYANEVREHIIKTVSEGGGHLSSNLGTVELSIAIHYVFNAPEDKIIWDVGHQAYTHKIITGRREEFEHIRQNGGISGFPKMDESPYDCFSCGHSSTSLSIALGFAHAKNLKKQDYNVIGIIGDGALTGGMAFEALNDIGESQAPVLIVLNDNEMSISKNVGAFSRYLSRLRVSKRYSTLKVNTKRGMSALPFGEYLVKAVDKVKDVLKKVIVPSKIFENLGIKYYGPFDGHNIKNLITTLNGIKDTTRPVLLHLVTSKGKGLYEAAKDPEKFHGVNNGVEKKENKFSEILGNTLVELAKNDSNITAITAAMPSGTGLDIFKTQFPSRYYDVGIAEQHAVTMAAAMAAGGLKPYFAVYSTFLQRGFDQVLHDVCINALPVRFLIDRAGVTGADGVTHQGVFDLSYLGLLPNMTILTPKDGQELKQMLEFSTSFNAPLAIRYPKSFNAFYEQDSGDLLKWQTLKTAKSRVYILATGNRMLDEAVRVNANVINARCIKPLDADFLVSINKKGNLIITLEDNIKHGGFGESVLSYCNGCGLKADIKVLAHPDRFIENFDILDSLKKSCLTSFDIEKIIKDF